jgi:hypothetical protein
MPTDPRDTPVLIIVFNRPDKVVRLMAALAVSKPRHLYVAADGPRSHRPDDIEKCARTRALATAVTWDCEVHTYFSETNKGCRLGVSSGITWFFSQVEAGIILEDDCIPTPAFFTYTTELLHIHQSDERIMHINGSSFLTLAESGINPASYYVSALPLVWGWATWRRAWVQYDINMKQRDYIVATLTRNHIFAKKSFAIFWQKLFGHILSARVDTWDAQWVYTIMNAGGVTITPPQNLIENIGFDADATHTTENSPHALKSATTELVTLIHPSDTTINKTLDTMVMHKVFIIPLWKKVFNLVKSKLS